jgi:hypothetical protein
MNPLEVIEKLITEHGSAAILGQHLAFAKDQFSALERQVTEYQAKTAKLEAQLEIEQMNHKETKQQFQRLQDEHSEDIRVHKGIEFRRGKRTGGNWVAFCPVCHTPADTTALVMCANQKCKWHLIIAGNDIPKIIAEL